MRTSSTIHVGRLAGIPIGIQPLWLVIVGFIGYALGHDYLPIEDPGLSQTAAYALGLVSALGVFGGIVLHELGHAIVARRRGLAVGEIDLWPLGGVARIDWLRSIADPKRRMRADEIAPPTERWAA